MAKRRANGEGTLRRRPTGLWEYTVMDGFQDDGKRKYKSFYGKTQKEAKDKYFAWREALDSGLVLESNYLFPEWADLWFENHKDNITATTQEGYRYTLRILKEAFRKRHLTEIKAYDVELFLKKLKKEGRSDSMLSQCRGMLYQIMNKAEANDLIHKNPVRFADKMRKRGPEKKKEAFNAEEVSILMERLPDDRIGWSMRLMLATGMRMQEILGLEPKHIEPDGSYIHITQAVNLVKGMVQVGEPKSRDSYRDVPIPESVRWCAVKLRTTDKRFVWEAGKADLPCNPSHFRDQFKKSLEAIPEVRVLTPHCCRHTYVSQMQALGIDMPTIQSIVGHADTDMTMHYLHVQESIRQAAIKKFAEAFPSASAENTMD